MRIAQLLFFIAVFVSSCGDSTSSDPVLSVESLRGMMVSPPATRADVEKNEIISYALNNKLAVQKTPSGIFYTVSGEGTGPVYTPTSIATAHYSCKRMKDGFVTVDTKKGGSPFEYSEKYTVAKGLAESFGLLKPGQKGTFLVPSALGHGTKGAGNYYPPNTILIYEIEMIKMVDQKEKLDRQNKKDQKVIEDYLAKKNLQMEKTADGIHYILTEEGSGPTPPEGASVQMKYAVSFMDDFEITNTYQRPGEFEEFNTSTSMKYWAKIVPHLKKGGKGKFIVPSTLAFGDREAGNVPANSCLIIDCELIDFK